MTKMKTSSSDNYCLKRVTIRMSDKKTYYTTRDLSKEYRDNAENDDIFLMEHVNDDECNWDNCPQC